MALSIEERMELRKKYFPELDKQEEKRESVKEKTGVSQVLGSFFKEAKGDFLGVGEDILRSSGRAAENITEAAGAMERGEQSFARTGLQQTGAALGAGASAIGAAVEGAVKLVLPQKAEDKIKEIAENLGQEVASRPEVQNIASWYANLPEKQQRDLDAVGGVLSLATEFAGAGAVKQPIKRAGAEAVEQISRGASRIADTAGLVRRSADEVVDSAGGFVRAIKETGADISKEFSPQQLSERNFAKSFKLAPGDVAELDSMAGGPVSEWAISNKLIAGTGEETVENIAKFKLDNYNSVRDAVGAVDETFSFRDVPEAENIVDDLIEKTGSLKSREYQNINSQLRQAAERLNRGEASLSDVQFIKSALDDIESIFKRSGSGGQEFKQGLRFKDLGESRSEVQKFIEDTVAQKFPNINIRELNRNVRVARGLVDDIAKRAGKFDTASSASLGDYFVFGLGQQALPGAGPALFGIKKVVESAPIRLRLTKWLSRKKGRVKETDIKEIQRVIAEELDDQLGLTR